MLLSLHVKNLALIEEEEVDFSDGLNILTGETGAGKSIIIGSINLALGAKADRGIIRNGAEFALIELTFQLDTERQVEKLAEMGIEPERENDDSDGTEEKDFPGDPDRVPGKSDDAALEGDSYGRNYGTILIKRKIYPTRSQCSVQGETVTAKELRELGETLIDIYGQRENGRLLRRQAQLGVIDEFAGEEDAALLSEVRDCYKSWSEKKRRLDSDNLDEAAQKREIDLLSFEVKEIQDAELKPGEDEELETKYRKLSSFRKISEAVQAADQLLEGGSSGSGGGDFGGDGGSEESAADQIGRAVRVLAGVSGIDPELDPVIAQVSDLDSMMSDTARALSDYMGGMTFDPQEFQEIEARLDLINHLKDKYGGRAGTLEAIGKALETRQARLEELSDYDASRAKLQTEIDAEYRALMATAGKLSAVRHRAADDFQKRMTEELKDLNFNQVDFRVEFQGEKQGNKACGSEGNGHLNADGLSGNASAHETGISAKGFDDVRFYISMNPGEPPRPLEDVASGGELSRIMLALKTVFAGKDDIHTFIFDEIDTGISGQTAWKVAVKMGRLAVNHQIICITHLPQIAAMEERHFLIEKVTDGERTATHIRPLSEEESAEELGRMMGGETVTETTLESAREMKNQARKAREQEGE